MENQTVHLFKAIDIIKGVINEDFCIICHHVSAVFDSLELNIAKNQIDKFFDCAKNQKDYSKSLLYDKEKSSYENMEQWSDLINSSEKFLTWKELSKKQQDDFWNAIGKLDHYNKKETDLNNIYNGLREDFYYHINKSLLNAEYLLCDDYKSRIQEAVVFLENLIGNYNSIGIKKPLFIKNFIVIASHLCDLCWNIANVIDEKDNRRIEISTYYEEKANRFARGCRFRFENEDPNENNLFLFTLSVIEMTTIDHMYIVSSENISKLITLWDRINNVEKLAQSEIKNMVELVKSKTASLLYKMVVDYDNRDLLGLRKVNFYYSVGTDNNIDISEDIKSYVLPPNLNETIKKKEELKDETISESNLPQKKLEDESKKDISRYNEWVSLGQKCYCEKSSLIENVSNQSDLNGIIKDISRFNENHRKNPEYFSPYYFLLVLNFIKTRFEKETKHDLKADILSLLQNTLDCLKQYVGKYKKRMPPVFRPYFENSFYQKNASGFESANSDINEYIKNYDCNNFKNSFFFASYGCNAISINRLEEKYESFVLLFNQWSSAFAKELYEKTIGIEKKQNEQQEVLTQQFIKLGKQEEDIKNTQRSSLQTLGLFTAFLSFIVSTIGTFRVVGNLSEYIIYSLTFTLAVVLFAFLISDHNSKLYSEKDKPFRFIKYIVYVIVLFLLVGFSRYYYTNEKFSKPKEETKDGHHITIHNSSAQNSTVNLNDVVPNNADTIK